MKLNQTQLLDQLTLLHSIKLLGEIDTARRERILALRWLEYRSLVESNIGASNLERR